MSIPLPFETIEHQKQHDEPPFMSDLASFTNTLALNRHKSRYSRHIYFALFTL